MLILELEGKGDILTARVEYESLCYEMKTMSPFCLLAVSVGSYLFISKWLQK